MEEFTPIQDRPAKPPTLATQLLRFVVVPLAFLSGLYGLFHFIILRP